MPQSLLNKMTSGPGWITVKAENMTVMRQVRDIFVDSTAPILGMPSEIETIRRDLSNVGEAKVNGLSALPFEQIPAMILEAFKETVISLSGKELFLQRRPHVMFNIPSKTSEKSDDRHAPSMSHIDAMSGVSPNSMTLWVPLHDLNDDMGIWIIDQHRSMELLNREESAGRVMGRNILDIDGPYMQQRTFARLKFGEAIIFNPFCLHGSIPNSTRRSRICVNFRFQSRSKPLFLKSSDYFTPHELH